MNVTTWPEMPPIDGSVLLIVNSPRGDVGALERIFDALSARVPPSRLHVIATAGWSVWLSERGWSDERVLLGADTPDGELELNYLLETADALRWIGTGRFAAIIGSAPHNLYNEEIKDPFEQRVGVILGAGHFLAHVLPAPYVFSFTLADLLQRFNRDRKAVEYSAACRAVIDDVFRLWTEGGKPETGDGQSLDDVTAVLAHRLGAGVLAWDEATPIPISGADGGAAAAEFLAYLGGTLTGMVGRQQDTLGRLQAEIERRDVLLAELNAQAIDLQRALGSQQEETNQRDQRLAALHEELAREVEIRDRGLAALHEEMAREVQIRDLRLVELHEELVKQVQIRDQNLVAMDQDRRESVALRDGIINDLRRQIDTGGRGSRR